MTLGDTIDAMEAQAREYAMMREENENNHRERDYILRHSQFRNPGINDELRRQMEEMVAHKLERADTTRLRVDRHTAPRRHNPNRL